MTLMEYMTMHKLSDQDMLDRMKPFLGKAEAKICSKSAVNRYKLGQRMPPRHRMIAIFEATQRNVTANDFNGTVPDKKPEKAGAKG